MSSANTGQTILSGHALNGPLGLTIAPDGHIIVANANDGNLVEVSTGGSQVAFKNVDLTGAGAGTLFGLEITPDGKGIYYVNDGDNTLDVLK
jgi:DNA-binding beta-propeller fold protein YncE